MKRVLFALASIMFLGSISSFSQVTTTISAGNWNTAGNWSNGVPGATGTATVNQIMTLDTDLTIRGNYTVTDLGEIVDPAGGADYDVVVRNSGVFDVTGNVLIGGNLSVQNSGLFIVRGCDTMTVQGDVTFSQTSTVVVESCAVLIVEGNMDMNNSNGTIIDGNVVVVGNLTTSNSSFIAGAGNIQIDGVTSINNPSTVFGSTTGCSDCSFGPGGALPIELLSFSGTQRSQAEIEVNWETLTELNNDFFTIEYSVDGEIFRKIADVPGAGNSQTLKKYRYIFEHRLVEVIYLRLTQTDYDGKHETFDLITVSPKKSLSSFKSNLTMLVYPNPSKSSNTSLNVFLNRTTEGNGTITIHDIKGSLLFQKEYENEELKNRIEIRNDKIYNLEKGIYYISVIQGNQRITEKLVVI